MYHGVMVKPLKSFGEFEIESNSQEWPWICDRTSGEVHRDMKTVSKLYNQDLNLPAAALAFIMQSSKLQEEARWEELKAVFYGFYPESTQLRAVAELEKLSILEASRIICKKTSNFAHEAILKPINDIVCNDDTAKSINREIETMRGVAESAVQAAKEALARKQKALKGYETLDESLLVISESPWWTWAIKNSQYWQRRYIEARFSAFQLKHATARYEKRTQWIHIKTRRILFSDEADSLFAQLYRPKKIDDTPFRGTGEEIKIAYSQKIEAFKVRLRFSGTGPLKDFDPLHNSERFQAYEFRVPYQEFSPQECTTLFRDLFEKPPPDFSYTFVSTPEISRFPKSHHEVLVYIDVSAAGKPVHYKSGMSITTLEPHEFCLKCFQPKHGQSSCPQLKRGYGVIIQSFWIFVYNFAFLAIELGRRYYASVA